LWSLISGFYVHKVTDVKSLRQLIGEDGYCLLPYAEGNHPSSQAPKMASIAPIFKQLLIFFLDHQSRLTGKLFKQQK